MDILDLLRADHDKLKELMATIEKTTTRGQRARTDGLQQVEAELGMHMAFEESELYPLVKARADAEGRELALEAYAEHYAATDVLKKLKAMDTSDEMWKATFMVLKENIEHHVREEEKELFKQVRSLLDREERDHLGEEYSARKARGPTRLDSQRGAASMR